jgi:hypothetical protein
VPKVWWHTLHRRRFGTSAPVAELLPRTDGNRLATSPRPITVIKYKSMTGGENLLVDALMMCEVMRSKDTAPSSLLADSMHAYCHPDDRTVVSRTAPHPQSAAVSASLTDCRPDSDKPVHVPPKRNAGIELQSMRFKACAGKEIVGVPTRFAQSVGKAVNALQNWARFPRTSIRSGSWTATICILAFMNVAQARPVAPNPTSQPQPQPTPTIPAMISTSSVKGSATVLAVLSSALITITYSILIGAGTRMTSSSKLPFSCIAGNIGALLERTWPDGSSPLISGVTAKLDALPDAIRLFYVGKMGDGSRRVARGLRRCEALPDAPIETPPFWLTAGSPLTTNMIQLAVWEWVFLWISIAMVISTLLYNGFLTENIGPDGYLRLSVVLLYAVANCFHAIYVWSAVSTFLTLVGMGAAWSLLGRANFAVVDLEQLERWLNRPSKCPRLDFKMIGKASAEFSPASYSADLEPHIPGESDSRIADAVEETDRQSIAISQRTIELEPHPEVQKELRNALATIEKVQETERDSCREAAKLALERVVANGMIMAAIVLSSGFSVWITVPVDPSSSQLGSLALLGSFSLGAVAMFTSAVQLTISNSSFEEIVLLKEVKINGHAVQHIMKRVSATTGIGFTYGTAQAHRVRLRDLVTIKNISDLVHLLLFGPAHTLLPTKADQARVSPGTQFELTTTVRRETVLLTTGGTDRHNKDERGVNLEAINVCYRPRQRVQVAARRGKREA